MNQLIGVIKKFSPVVSLNEEKFEEFSGLLKENDITTKWSLKEIEEYVNTLKIEFCNDKCPAINTVGERAIKESFEIFSNQVYSYYALKSGEDEECFFVYEKFFDLMFTAMEGNYISSGNESCFDKIFYQVPGVIRFTKNMNENHVKRFIKSLTRKFEPRPQETDESKWKKTIKRWPSEIIYHLKKEGLLQSRKEIIIYINFWLELSQQYKGSSSDNLMIYVCHEMLSFAASMVRDMGGSTLFEEGSTDDVENLLRTYHTIFFMEDFPRNECAVDAWRDIIVESLQVAIKDNNKLTAITYDFTSKVLFFGNDHETPRSLSDLAKALCKKYMEIDFESVGMKSHLDIFIEEVKMMKEDEHVYRQFEHKEEIFLNHLVPKFQDNVDKLKELLVVIIKNPLWRIACEYFEGANDKKKLVNLKKNPEIFNLMFSTMDNPDIPYNTDTLDAFKRIGYTLYDIMEKQKVFKKMTSLVYDVIESAFKYTKHPIHSAIWRFSIAVDWKDELPRFNNILVRIKSILEKDQNIVKKFDILVEVVDFFFQKFSYVYTNDKRVLELKDNMADLYNYCYTLPWTIDEDDERLRDSDISDEESLTLAGYFLFVATKYFYIPNNNITELVIPIVQTAKNLRKQEDNDLLQGQADKLLKELTDTADILGDDTGKEIIDEFLQTEDNTLLTKVILMYPQFTDYIHEKLPTILEISKRGNLGIEMNFLSLLNQVASKNPQVFNQDTFDYLIDQLEGTKVTQCYLIFQSLTTKQNQLFQKHDKRFAELVQNDSSGLSYCNILPEIANSLEKAQYFTKVLWEKLQSESGINRATVIYALRNMALRFKEPVLVYKSHLTKMKDDVQIKDSVTALLDTLEGRSLETVAIDVEEQREDIDNLDSRVTNNEDKIENLDNDVRETKEDVANVKQDVKETKERIDQIEYTIKGLDERVEELSHMTLSHAPAWTRHVSELMNDQTDHDWRLLAMKLNYTNDDIRNWATQPDPCLSMFDEWFATHKTREATNAILTNLKEMNRLDAAEIVESALANVKDVVQDDEDEEFEKPEVFLSYQWGHQQEVKLLRKHLEMAGFKAWMDIGQMGGGDKLYAKIDDGVRSAKVIISCVSEKYAKSANCCREVNLSTNLGKPMIPILMEQLSWPPAGPMGPIMSEYLYIRFFKSGGMEKGDSVFWLPAKFQELLMQVRYFVVPDMKLITNDSPYKGWMNPPEEEIIIPKREQKAIESSNGKSEENTEQEVSPDVFISYQWGKQPQIKRLYKKLSEMGYYCWLDIMQMGGGDSLFDKIDKGIRGAKVIISCVTPKYALSANCRREVSLSGALSKPIVPLLLEDMKWPPEGPMSMTFTELLYIGFHRKKDDKLWEGDEFNQLISKIDLNASGCRMISEAAETNESSKKAEDNEEAARKRKLEEENKQKELEKENAKRIEEERRKEAEEMKEKNTDQSPKKKSSLCVLL
ncbi:DgyrCDS8667 [Dimorphilus gyrociliatus]|uniref:DgyrCDS8667 n=1 Tax=Dimorphilus gyrociliatus TaxID=2664684 RepID=A0A7I8VX11_9ANNE|nr:DgyrCDS8667 [Dimorphilus gyrociliatus]